MADTEPVAATPASTEDGKAAPSKNQAKNDAKRLVRLFRLFSFYFLREC